MTTVWNYYEIATYVTLPKHLDSSKNVSLGNVFKYTSMKYVHMPGGGVFVKSVRL